MSDQPKWQDIKGTETEIMVPHMASLLGIDQSPKPKWMPKWIWNLKKRRKEENSLMGWKPVHHEPSKEEVAMQIAQELRDFAELIVGHSHVDPEKSIITRSKRKVGCNLWLQHFKYAPPKVKELTKRGQRRMARKVIRETKKKLAGMGIKV